MPFLHLKVPKMPPHGKSIVDLLIEAGFCSSKSDAKRQINNKAIRLNDITVTDVNSRLCFTNDGFTVLMENENVQQIDK
jgi:tyrosyl-tRNA synthetase